MKICEYTEFPNKLDTKSVDLIRDGAILAHLAYSGSAEHMMETLRTERKYKGLLDKIIGIPELIDCANCDAQAFLINYLQEGDKKPALIIDCRGTSSLTDWLCNISTYQTPFVDFDGKKMQDVSVHAGFYRQFKGLFSIFEGKVKDHLNASGKIICVGHSLGAAVACIAALYYGAKYKNQVSYVGFGGPRCGNEGFTKAFDAHMTSYFRCKNASDPVPACIPPLGYSHCGSELHFGPKDFLSDVPLLLDVLDHCMTRYLDAIEMPEKAQAATPAATSNWLLKTLSIFSL